MQKFFTLALAAALLLGGASSCKKDGNETTPGGGDKTPAFVGKTFTVQSIKMDPPFDLDGDGKPDDELTKFLDPCDLDDAVIFQPDGKLIEDHGTNRCDPAEARTEHTSNWAYADGKITMTDVADPTDKSVWNILESNNSTLKVQLTIIPDETSGQAIKATMTMKAK